jgi:hypothetical protein
MVDDKTGIAKGDVDVAKAAFCTFSLRPRGFDVPIVYMEVALTLAHLLWVYDMRLPEDAASTELSGRGRVYAKTPDLRPRDRYQLAQHLLAERDGPMMEFRARLDGGDRKQGAKAVGERRMAPK